MLALLSALELDPAETETAAWLSEAPEEETIEVEEAEPGATEVVVFPVAVAKLEGA
jgi:hypothetical protein